MGSITLLDLEKSVLSLLNENYNSVAADLPTGSGGSATIPTIITSGSGEATVKTYLNDGAADLAQTCLPIPGTATIYWASGKRFNNITDFVPSNLATYSGAAAKTITGATNASPIVVTSTAHGFTNGMIVTVASVGGNTNANGNWRVMNAASNTFELYYTDGVTPSSGNSAYTSGGTATRAAGNIPWAVRGAKYSSTALVYCDRTALERHDRDWMTTANATPSYWYNDGNLAIGLYAKPSSAGTVTVDTYDIPTPLVSTTDTIPGVPDDLTDLIVFYAAAKVAYKNLEDPSLAPRAKEWQAQYDAGRMDLWRKLSPSIQRAHYPTPPMATK